MAQYRLFFFDGAGHIELAREFEAENDNAAIETAAVWAQRRRVELWERDRRVKRWN